MLCGMVAPPVLQLPRYFGGYGSQLSQTLNKQPFFLLCLRE